MHFEVPWQAYGLMCYICACLYTLWGIYKVRVVQHKARMWFSFPLLQLQGMLASLSYCCCSRNWHCFHCVTERRNPQAIYTQPIFLTAADQFCVLFSFLLLILVQLQFALLLLLLVLVVRRKSGKSKLFCVMAKTRKENSQNNQPDVACSA